MNLVCTTPACPVYTSSDVPKPIPDVTTITSTVNVGGSFTLTDVNVTLSIAHTWDSDLDVFLISPQGARVELFTDVGGSADNFTNTVLDDECATSIASGAAPFTGCYRPEGSLSAFIGEHSSGVWTLEITDDAGADTGTLQAWSLELCSAGDDVDSDGDGWTNGEESHVGTDPMDACPDFTGSPGLCPGPACDGDDAWPLDMNVDTAVTVPGDVLAYRGNIGESVDTYPELQRLDLNADGAITVPGDVLMYRDRIGETCT
jgi:subtilisin-like proprotein convertase family protein